MPCRQEFLVQTGAIASQYCASWAIKPMTGQEHAFRLLVFLWRTSYWHHDQLKSQHLNAGHQQPSPHTLSLFIITSLAAISPNTGVPLRRTFMAYLYGVPLRRTFTAWAWKTACGGIAAGSEGVTCVIWHHAWSRPACVCSGVCSYLAWSAARQTSQHCLPHQLPLTDRIPPAAVCACMPLTMMYLPDMLPSCVTCSSVCMHAYMYILWYAIKICFQETVSDT